MKHIRLLRQKKYRDRYNVFVAEGDKIVQELLRGTLQVEMICGLDSWVDGMQAQIPPHVQCITVSPKELGRISTLKTPNQVLAVVKQPAYPLPQEFDGNELILMLDSIRDPGNLGTIIRTADWFGVRHIFCSPCTADVYNPKVIQASMGSFIRIKVHYQALEGLIRVVKDKLMIYGAFPEGKDVWSASLSLPAALLIGNESKGISADIASLTDHKLSIPHYHPGDGPQAAESLNAAMASGIMMACFRHKAQI